MTRRTLTFVGEVGDEQRRVAEVVRAPLVVAAGPEHEAGRRRVVRVAQAAQQVARAVGVCVAVAFAHAACQKIAELSEGMSYFLSTPLCPAPLRSSSYLKRR